jgi:four helix bundle protein
MQIESHRDLHAWQRAMEYVVEIYKLSSSFPKEELYGLTSQLRRAAVSVPANIAEGHSRATAKDYASFLAISRGSLMESQTLLQIAVRLGFISDSSCMSAFQLCEETSKMLTSLRSRLLESAGVKS